MDNTSVIDKEVFDTFFKENCCELEYDNVRQEFEAAVEGGLEAFFTDETDITKITEKNFIVYMKGDIYCEFEAIVEENFEALNPEVVDAVMEVTATMENGDELTEIYWETLDTLLKNFLVELYRTVIARLIDAC